VWNDHAQQLHDDRRRDVRQDPQSEDRELEQCTTGEQVDQLVETAGVLVCRETGLDVGKVYERRRDERAEAVQGDDAEREPDFPAKVRRAEDPRNGAKQKASS
jgi:hypothetical protein